MVSNDYHSRARENLNKFTIMKLQYQKVSESY